MATGGGLGLQFATIETAEADDHGHHGHPH